MLKKELNKIKSTNTMLTIENERLREKALPHILIVDDDIDIRYLIKTCLEKDYYILEASNGTEAIKILFEKNEQKEDEPVNLIILDIMMPNMDGYEVIKILKRDKATKNIPVVFFSAKTQKKEIEKGLSLGARGYLTKPFNPEKFPQKIRKFIS